jgi:D-sedoheptulose 7-phosphate isomerase
MNLLNNQRDFYKIQENKEVLMDYINVIDDLAAVARLFFLNRNDIIENILKVTSENMKKGNKILIYGNGGSAAQAQHFAAELVNKFLRSRKALTAIALNTDTSALTSIANDSSYDYVFSRQIEALGKPDDISVGISTSGNSPNVLKALESSKDNGLVTVALTGEGGGQLSGIPDFLLDVPSNFTPRIQEVHLLFLHLFAQELEERLT